MPNKLVGFAIVFGVVLALFWSSRGRAAPEAAGPQAIPLHLEGALINASGNMIKFLDVPAGKGRMGSARDAGFKYFDIECSLSLMSDGTVHVDRAAATLSAHLPENTEHFTSGTYDRAGYPLMTVTGPATSVAGRFVWVFSSSYRSGSWTTGPAEGHPQLNLLALPTDAVLPGGYSYGSDDQGKLIAVQQVEDQITISWLKPAADKDRPHAYAIDHADVSKMKPPEAKPK